MAKVQDGLDRWLRRYANTCFPERMKIYAPTCYGRCLSAVQRLVNGIVGLFGGATVYDAEGSWVDDNGNVIREPVKVIEVGHSCLKEPEAQKLVQIINQYA